MSNRESTPGFGERIERVRARLELTKRAFSGHFGIAEGSYRNWLLEDASTSALVLKRGLVSLGVPDVDRALSWLADGGGAPPYWLDGEPGSPIPPQGPDGTVAMPSRALEVGRELFRVLDRARAVGELRDPLALKVWARLDEEPVFREDGDDVTDFRSAGTSSSAKAA